MGRSSSFWLHVSLSGMTALVAVIYGGFPLAYRLGYWDWSRPNQDLFIAVMLLAVAVASAAILAGTTIYYQLRRR